MSVRECFVLGSSRVKALDALKKERKKEEESEDDETGFSPFSGSSPYYHFQLLCGFCRNGATSESRSKCLWTYKIGTK